MSEKYTFYKKADIENTGDWGIFDLRTEQGREDLIRVMSIKTAEHVPQFDDPEKDCYIGKNMAGVAHYLKDSGFEYAILRDPENAFRFWFTLINVRNGSVIPCPFCGDEDSRIYAVRMHIGGYCLKFSHCEGCNTWLVSWPSNNGSCNTAVSTYLDWDKSFIRLNVPIFASPQYIDLFSIPKGDDPYAQRLGEEIEKAIREAQGLVKEEEG